MIKIIKHGHKPFYNMTCKYCECVFMFEESDICKSGFEWNWSEWVNCPDCGYENYIKHHPTSN